jgi:hypothetical protein
MAADAAFSFVEGDTASILRVTCKNKVTGVVIDLTGAAVQLQWKTRKQKFIERTMTLVNPPTDGIAEYQFAAGELESPSMKFEVEITDGIGKVFHSLDVLFELVRKQLK